MTVTVKLFARARDIAGMDCIALDIPEGASAGELRQRLAAVCPKLGTFSQRCALAINHEFAHDSAVVPLHADVALLPPVSGGQPI
jgi:molybdopterin converting factor subunit 1